MLKFPIKKKFRYLFLLLCGIGAGFLWFVEPGVVFSIFIIFITGFSLRKFAKPEDRNFLTKLFISAVCIRIILGFGTHFYSVYKGGYGTLFHDDAGMPRLAWRTAQYHLGSADSIYDPLEERNVHTDFLAVLFYFFGFSRLTGKLFNMLFLAIASILIYSIAKEVFNKRVAKLSAILVAFFPSLIIWSCVNLKDSMAILLIVTIIWAMTEFLKKYRLIYLLFILFPIIILFDLRGFLVLIIVPVLIFVFIGTLKLKPAYKITTILVAIILLYNLLPIANDYVKTKYPGVRFDVNFLLSIHKGYWSTGGTLYRIYDQKFYSYPTPNLGIFSPDFLRALFRGWVHFLLVPFPWQITTNLQWISFPQMIIWIILLPLALLGFLTGLRYNWRKMLLIAIFLFAITSAYALSEGNVGTAARHRDMLTPFYLILSSAGILKISHGKIFSTKNE